MNNISFYNTFSLKRYSYTGYRHTDNSRGITTHYIGRIISGKARFVSDRREELVLREGDYFYLPKDMRYHSYWNGDVSKQDKVEWYSFSFEYFPSESDVRYKAQRLYPSEDLRQIFEQIAEDMKVSARTVGWLYVFLGQLIEDMEPTERAVTDALLTRAMRYISEHPDLKVPELAKHCGISESGLYAFFKKNVGATPIEVKNRMKADEAVVLLESTGLSVEQISARLGFSTSAYFRKIIKEQTGKTPLKIRKEAKII